MKIYRQSPKGLGFIRLSLLLLSIGVIITATIYLVRYPMLMYIVIGIFCFGAFFVGAILLPLYMSNMKYMITDECVVKLCGVIFKKRSYLSVRSIQYVTRLSPPFSRYTGLSFIKIYSQGRSMRLCLLDEEDSLEIFFLISKSIRKEHYDKHSS